MAAIKPETTGPSKQAAYRTYFAEIALLFCWAIVQGSLYYQYGIGTRLEAAKYIYEADYFLKHGTVDTPNYWLYSTQIFLLAAAQKLNTGYFAVYIIQLLFNLLATFSFYRFIGHISNKRTAIILCLFLIFNFPLQTFNTFLQTESLFHSFIIFFSCYLLRLESLGPKKMLNIVLFLVLISFTRPSGLLFIPGTFLFLFFRFFRAYTTPVKIGITVAISLIFLFFLNIALGSGGEIDLMLPFRDERIICGVPTLPGFIPIKASNDPNSIYGLMYYVVNNPGQFFRLSWLRTKAFFGMSRSYYSTTHNLYLYFYFFPFYFFMIAGAGQWWRKNKHVLLYCLTFMLLTWGTVILTCDDWHNRFFLTLVPFIYILSAPFIQMITSKNRANASN